MAGRAFSFMMRSWSFLPAWGARWILVRGGINLYATVAILGLASVSAGSRFLLSTKPFDHDWGHLHGDRLYAVEFLADKSPLGRHHLGHRSTRSSVPVGGRSSRSRRSASLAGRSPVWNGRPCWAGLVAGSTHVTRPAPASSPTPALSPSATGCSAWARTVRVGWLRGPQVPIAGARRSDRAAGPDRPVRGCHHPGFKRRFRRPGAAASNIVAGTLVAIVLGASH